jgi:hypothetical protein
MEFLRGRPREGIGGGLGDEGGQKGSLAIGQRHG